MTQREVFEFFSHIDPFSRLPNELLQELSQGTSIKHIPSKKMLFFEGEDGDAGYVVISGRVALLKTSPNGKELIIELLPAGEIFGVVVLFENRPYPLTARAQTDSVIAAFPRSVAAPLFTKEPMFQRGLMEVISSRMRRSQNLARAIAHDQAETRLSSILLALIPRFSPELKNKAPEITISRQELADLAGITLETASRVMKAFERENIVNLEKNGVITILDLDALDQMSGGVS